MKRFAFNNDGDLYNIRIKPLYKKSRAKPTNSAKVCYIPNKYRFENPLELNHKLLFDVNYVERNAFKCENWELRKIFDDIDHGRRLFQSEARKLLKILFSIKRRNPKYSEKFNVENSKEAVVDTIAQMKKEMGQLSDEFLKIKGCDD